MNKLSKLGVVAALSLLPYFPQLRAQTKDNLARNLDTSTSTEKVEIQVDPALKNLVETTFTTLDGETLKNTAEIFQLEFSSPNSKAKTFEEQELFIKLVEASLKWTEAKMQFLRDNPDAVSFLVRANSITKWINKLQEINGNIANIERSIANSERNIANNNIQGMKILWSFYELYKITKDTQTKKDFIERVISRRNHYDKFGDTYPKELQQIIQELGDIVSPKKTYVVGSKDF